MASLSTSASGGGSAIQVVVRLRPMNDAEKRHGTLPVVTAKTQERTVTVIKGKGKKQMKSSYSFDNVFTAFSTQEEVFEATVKPVIVDVMRGFESTVFAYGQTGTGKTHTMEGSLDSPELYGVIPRSAQAIFEHLRQPQYKEQVVTCSYLEIYNEELRDLLLENGGGGAHGGGQKLDIMEGKDGTFCRGLTEKQVHSAADVLNLMQRAQHSRMIGETKMNKSSSRSHCLFTIQVHGKISLIDGDGDMEFNGKLHMVDLAGSECAKSAGNDKSAPDAVARERERMNINRSLLTLGRVITILKEKSLNKNTNARIPYRDSKLTRVLQEALGGRCKTVIVATISPSITAIEESVSTLNYAHSANGIVNKPVSSSLIAFGENLPSIGSSSDSPAPTVESWQEMEMRLQYMQTQVDEAQAALARKHIQQQELQDRADKAEAELLESKQKLYAANKEIKSLKGVVEMETNKRKLTEKELQETQMQLKKTELVLKATQDTESSLTMEAQKLIGKLEDIIGDRDELHALVVSQRDRECNRRKATKEFQEAALAVLNNIESAFTNLSSSIETSQLSAVKVANLNYEVGRHSVTETQKLVSDIAKNVACVTDSIMSQLVGEEGMIPTLETNSSSVLTSMQSADEEFQKGEKSLEESRESMRRRLDECAKILEERASSIQTSTSQALQTFESKVVESKSAISHLVMRLKSSLSNLSDAKAEKAAAMDSLVVQWRDESLANSKSVLDATTSNSASLQSSIDAFEKGMHNHDDMKKSLEDQRTFLDSDGAAHVETIGEQGSLLSAHRQKLAESHDNQTKLRNEVMQTIMSGVHALVSSEMAKLATTQASHFQTLDNDGAELVDRNEKMTQSAKRVMENMQSTNQVVSEKASAVRESDAKASEAMKSSLNTLGNVTAATNTHAELTTDLAGKSLATMADMKQLDGQNSEVIKTAERDGKACSTALVNGVYKPTSAGIKAVVQSGLDAMAYVNRSVVPNVNGALDDVAESRKGVASQMSDKFERSREQLSAMAGQITTMAQAQHGSAERLGSEIIAASNSHANESVPYYYAELESGKEKLVSTLSSLAEMSTRITSEGKHHGDAVKQSVEDFARNKIQCNKPVDPAPQRKDCTFSHELSSTPAEDVILKGFELAQGEDAAAAASSELASVAAAQKPESDGDVDTSQDTHDDDASRKSCGSVCSLSGREHSSGSIGSLPSPRLKYRDTNVGQFSDSGSKSRKQQRLAVNTTSSSAGRKNKCPSGLPTPSNHQSRKRMKR